MMTCKDVEHFLDDYLEGTLPWGVRLRFGIHVRMCPDCRPYIARYRRAIELGQRLLSQEPEGAASEAVPQDLIDAIVSSLDED